MMATSSEPPYLDKDAWAKASAGLELVRKGSMPGDVVAIQAIGPEYFAPSNKEVQMCILERSDKTRYIAYWDTPPPE